MLTMACKGAGKLSTKAEKELGLKSVYNLQETISETVSWYRYFNEDEINMKQITIDQIHNYTNRAKQLKSVWINGERE